MRKALSMSSYALANRLGCSRPNISALENREINGTITLRALEQVAQELNCKLVYCLIPLKPLEEILEKQARSVAKKRIREVNYSMRLEHQGLTAEQLKQEEDDMVQELLQGNLRHIWTNDD